MVKSSDRSGRAAGFVSEQGMRGAGDGGFGHRRLMIVAVILNDCGSDPIVWWKIVLRDLITSE